MERKPTPQELMTEAMRRYDYEINAAYKLMQRMKEMLGNVAVNEKSDMDAARLLRQDISDWQRRN